MTDWMKAIQSVGRGFRPGMEISVMQSGRKTGNSVLIDIESHEFTPWRKTFLTHYVEYHNPETDDYEWKKFNRQPNKHGMYVASKVIRHNADGTYEYIKDRQNGIRLENPYVADEDMALIILQARGD